MKTSMMKPYNNPWPYISEPDISSYPITYLVLATDVGDCCMGLLYGFITLVFVMTYMQLVCVL